MPTFTIRQAKANLSRLIDEAHEGKEIIIARGSKPMARLVPISTARHTRRPGSLKGKLRVPPEFFDPIPAAGLLGWG